MGIIHVLEGSNRDLRTVERLAGDGVDDNSGNAIGGGGGHGWNGERVYGEKKTEQRDSAKCKTTDHGADSPTAANPRLMEADCLGARVTS